MRLRSLTHQHQSILLLIPSHLSRQNVSKDELEQHFGKIWRVRATPRREATELALPGRAYSSDFRFIPYRKVLLENQRTTQLKKDATAFSLWNCGILLADYLQSCPKLVRGRNVLELGAGVGLVGLTAAAMGAKCVQLIDWTVAVPLLTKNVTANEALWRLGVCTQVVCSNWIGFVQIRCQVLTQQAHKMPLQVAAGV